MQVFLVAEDRAWLIGIGRQRTAIRGGRFAYQGGLIPVPCGQAEPLLRRAVESVAGLRGFVGVDFFYFYYALAGAGYRGRQSQGGTLGLDRRAARSG